MRHCLSNIHQQLLNCRLTVQRRPSLQPRSRLLFIINWQDKLDYPLKRLLDEKQLSCHVLTHPKRTRTIVKRSHPTQQSNQNVQQQGWLVVTHPPSRLLVTASSKGKRGGSRVFHYCQRGADVMMFCLRSMIITSGDRGADFFSRMLMYRRSTDVKQASWGTRCNLVAGEINEVRLTSISRSLDVLVGGCTTSCRLASGRDLPKLRHIRKLV